MKNLPRSAAKRLAIHPRSKAPGPGATIHPMIQAEDLYEPEWVDWHALEEVEE